MPTKYSFDLVTKVLDSQQKEFPTVAQQLAWERGYLAALLATLVDQDVDVQQKLISRIKRK